MNEIEIQTSETIETLEKKNKDQSELCAKLREYRAMARERDEWKKKFEDLQMAFKEEEIKKPEGAINGEVEPSVTGRSGDDELLGGIQGHTSQDEGTAALRTERARGSSADITVCSEPEKYDTGSFRHLSGSPVSRVIQSGGQSNDE